MNFSKKIIKILENYKPVDNRFEYGCAMIFFDFPEINDLHSKIKVSDIYNPSEGNYGLETQPHATLLFGLHDEEIKDKEVFDICLKEKYDDITLDKISLFKNDVFEVLKFDVSSDSMHRINSELKELPHTTKYAKYHPHATIAYLNPGKGDKYVTEFNKIFKDKYPIEVTPKEIVFSKTNKTKVKKPIL